MSSLDGQHPPVGPSAREPDGAGLPRLLGDLHELHACGVITAAEYANGKRRLLSGDLGPASAAPSPRPVPAPVPVPVGRRRPPAVVALAIGGALLVVMAGLIVGAAVIRQVGSAAGYTTAPSDAAPQNTSPQAAAPSAQEQLDGFVAADRAEVEGLLGTWVPQLAAKRVGQAPDGTITTEASIVDNHRAHLRTRPDLLLLRSDDYGSFRLPGYFVTIAPQPFGTGEEALGWCVGQGFGPDDCFAKRIVVSGTPEGNTLYQQ
ncbi:SHOCT domain-containing protein [Pseudonocardia saturnea]